MNNESRVEELAKAFLIPKYFIAEPTIPEEVAEFNKMLKAFKAGYSTSQAQWQLCPKCHGDGNLGRYNPPAYMSTTVTPVCDVCNGAKIIEPPSSIPTRGEDAGGQSDAVELREALGNLVDAIPRQTNDYDWWDDDLTRTVAKAKLLIRYSSSSPSTREWAKDLKSEL
jgi:hypothetical protein